MSTNHAGSTTTASEKPHHQSVAPGLSSPTCLNSSYARQQQHSITTTTNTIPTPASSAAGTVPPTTSHEDMEGDMTMDELTSGSGGENGPSRNHKRRRTDSSQDRGAHTIAPALRRRSGSDEHFQGTSPTIPTIQELLNQPDVRPYYLVCQQPHQMSYPDMTEGLLSIYGLKPLADKVARIHPVTGLKNKIRKSYKGYINDLSGKNVVETRSPQTDQPEGEPPAPPDMSRNLLTRLWRMPGEEWYNHEVHGKDLDKPLDLSKLRKALTLTKGDIPDFDASSLGLDEDLRRKTPHPATPALAVSTPHVNGSTPGGSSAISAVGGDDGRPKRGKRRRYDEGSYEGYDVLEGDDDSGVNNSVGVGGVSGGGVAGPSLDVEKRKKKRKKTDINSPGTGGGMNLSHHTHGSGISVQGLYGR
ncbi:hypothetical protein RUND412_000691 [Rhizina undulata]